MNNKIKVIKRTAYGFHDLGCFALEIKQAFPGGISDNWFGGEPESLYPSEQRWACWIQATSV